MPRSLKIMQPQLLEWPREPLPPSPTSAPPTRGTPKAQSDASLEDRILQLTETLYRIDMNGKPPRKPFKPFITQPRKRFKPGHSGRDGHFNPSNGRSFQSNHRGRQQGFKGRFKFKRPFGKFDKSPNTKRPRVSGRLLIKIKFAALDAKNLATCKGLSRTQQTSSRGHYRTQEV